jgi:DNA processing protein
MERLEALGWRTLDAAEIPGVSTLPEPPVLLFASGALDVGGGVIAVVGARRATGYGLRTAERMSRELAAAGVLVVSGLARGIDAAAHEGALSAGGRTVAVLGCGPDVAYPPENADLQHRIGDSGVLLTEHPPGVPPLPGHFPRRNRILVAVAQALLVIESRLKSGTLTSVRWACDLGRDVLVVPGPVDSRLSEGPLHLLREGATPVGTAGHVLEALGLDDHVGTRPYVPVNESSLTAAERRLLALLDGEGMHLDELVRVSGEPPGRLLTLLLALEVNGRVVRGDGLRYRVITG